MRVVVPLVAIYPKGRSVWVGGWGGTHEKPGEPWATVLHLLVVVEFPCLRVGDVDDVTLGYIEVQ